MTVETRVSETRSSHLGSRQQEKGREACTIHMFAKLSKVNLVTYEAWHLGRRHDFRCRSIQVGYSTQANTGQHVLRVGQYAGG